MLLLPTHASPSTNILNLFVSFGSYILIFFGLLNKVSIKVPF